MQLNSVSKITETAYPDLLVVSCEIVDIEGLTIQVEYPYRESDPYGINPMIKQWLAAHPQFPIDSYVAPLPPTAEELRAQMQPITARQLKLTLVRNGISLASVKTAIDAITDDLAREEALIEWESASTFKRNHPLLLSIAAALSLTPETVDTMWEQAAAIQ